MAYGKIVHNTFQNTMAFFILYTEQNELFVCS